MSFVDLPLVLTDIICEFAYNTVCKRDMFFDLSWQESVQKNIPMLFFTPGVPTLPMFTGMCSSGHFGSGRFHGSYYELFTPNPLKKGNPYYPTEAIHRDARVFSGIPAQCCFMLRNDVVRRARKYRGSLQKKVRAFIRQGLPGIRNWNQALGITFANPFWYRKESYRVENHVERELIRTWVRQLKVAAFVLPCDSPV